MPHSNCAREVLDRMAVTTTSDLAILVGAIGEWWSWRISTPRATQTSTWTTQNPKLSLTLQVTRLNDSIQEENMANGN